VIGLVSTGSAAGSAPRGSAFRKGLSETGYLEGQNVTIEYHWLEGRLDALPALMADLVRRQVAVIATPGSIVATLGAKAATTTIPIIFGSPEDPVIASHGNEEVFSSAREYLQGQGLRIATRTIRRIAIIRQNISELIEQAAAYSGAEDEERNADRIAQQEQELAKLIELREALLRK
jgi:hypothetical protein